MRFFPPFSYRGMNAILEHISCVYRLRIFKYEKHIENDKTNRWLLYIERKYESSGSCCIQWELFLFSNHLDFFVTDLYWFFFLFLCIKKKWQTMRASIVSDESQWKYWHKVMLKRSFSFTFFLDRTSMGNVGPT